MQWVAGRPGTVPPAWRLANECRVRLGSGELHPGDEGPGHGRRLRVRDRRGGTWLRVGLGLGPPVPRGPAAVPVPGGADHAEHGGRAHQPDHARHGILVLPIREPAILAKTAATIQLGSKGRLMLGVAAGWYEREFAATAVPFGQRGQIFERNLDLMYRLWDEDDVSGEWDG